MFTILGIALIRSYLLEVILRRAAQRADPIGGKILKIRSLRHTMLGVTDLRAVLIAAQLTRIHAHSYPPLRISGFSPRRCAETHYMI